MQDFELLQQRVCIYNGMYCLCILWRFVGLKYYIVIPSCLIWFVVTCCLAVWRIKYHFYQVHCPVALQAWVEIWHLFNAKKCWTNSYTIFPRFATWPFSTFLRHSLISVYICRWGTLLVLCLWNPDLYGKFGIQTSVWRVCFRARIVRELVHRILCTKPPIAIHQSMIVTNVCFAV